MKKLIFILAFGMAIGFYACENEEDDDDANGQSAITESTHNTGKNCMACHKFTAAGSVYNKALTSGYTGAKIKITTQPNGTGTLLGTLTSNKSGSFYTNSGINFSSGVYVSVTGTSGVISNMASPITTGACNSCHGSSSSKIWIE